MSMNILVKGIKSLLFMNEQFFIGASAAVIAGVVAAYLDVRFFTPFLKRFFERRKEKRK